MSPLLAHLPALYFIHTTLNLNIFSYLIPQDYYNHTKITVNFKQFHHIFSLSHTQCQAAWDYWSIAPTRPTRSSKLDGGQPRYNSHRDHGRRRADMPSFAWTTWRRTDHVTCNRSPGYPTPKNGVTCCIPNS